MGTSFRDMITGRFRNTYFYIFFLVDTTYEDAKDRVFRNVST